MMTDGSTWPFFKIALLVTGQGEQHDLKRLHRGYNEIEHAGAILARLDVAHVLANPRTCRSLRTLFGWCSRAIGRPFDERYQLAEGDYLDLTRPQTDALPASPTPAG